MTWQQNYIQVNYYSQGGPLSFIEENQRSLAEVAEVKQSLRQAEMEIMRRRAAAADQRPKMLQLKIDKDIEQLAYIEEVCRREFKAMRGAPENKRQEAHEIITQHANRALVRANMTLRRVDEWTGSEEWLNASEREKEEMRRKEDVVLNIKSAIREGMAKLEEAMSRPSEKDTEEMPVPMTADEAMAEMNKQSKALDEAKQKAKKEVDFEKSTAKMAAVGGTGLALLAALLITSSASGFLSGLAIIICIMGTIFFGLAMVGASGNAKKKEEQWDINIEVWENDLQKATNEWLKTEGIYDFSNPNLPPVTPEVDKQDKTS